MTIMIQDVISHLEVSMGYMIVLKLASFVYYMNNHFYCAG